MSDINEYLPTGENPPVGEFIGTKYLIQGVKNLVAMYLEKKGLRYSRAIEKSDNCKIKKAEDDILGTGENFRKICNKYQSHQIINAIKNILSGWGLLTEYGYNEKQVLENIKYYLGELGISGKNIGMYFGSVEKIEDITETNIRQRIIANFSINRLLSYGIGDDPKYVISFGLLDKLGVQDRDCFFDGTNTDVFSQFDFVVMCIFDLIRKEVLQADIRKKNHNRLTGLNQGDAEFIGKYQESINKGPEETDYSKIAQKNIDYYIGVLQLLLQFSQEQGQEKFSVKAGEYFKKVFRYIGGGNMDFELKRVKDEIEEAFGIEQQVPDVLPENVIPFTSKAISS